MAGYQDARWSPSFDATTRAARRGGRYHPYLPDPLTARPLVVDEALAHRAQRVEADVRRFTTEPLRRGLEGLARFLLRSEAIASSRIEGLQVSPQQIALAELAQSDSGVTRGFTGNAELVANNITTLRQASDDLARTETIDHDGIDRLHRALLPDEKHHGLRVEQNWIGGNSWNPLDAEFVPPPPDEVPALMADLCACLNSGVHAPLIQAALIHAQFETIHPYTDGNGRVGRALIHTVLVRRGLTPAALLPVSMVLLTRSDEYVQGLTAYRYSGPAVSDDAQRGTAAWLALFLDAVETAAKQARAFSVQVAELTEDWNEQLARHRAAKGSRSQPRTGSAVAELLDRLPELPVLTARTAQQILGVSFPAARTALEELAEANILRRKQVDRGTTGYLAQEVFDLLTFAERRLASTRWDTRESPTERAAPRPPQP
ncbi:Fic family protein [Saccharomonospora halophila]|uniref:Fic family protein n=1 Tax=Saccharomonospora halophila TaxID=129922 RepID=UPI00037B00DD|nr:Fic family protein [Saccharomonospora halophila]